MEKITYLEGRLKKKGGAPAEEVKTSRATQSPA